VEGGLPDSIGDHEKPTRQALLDFMQTIAGGNLSDEQGGVLDVLKDDLPERLLRKELVLKTPYIDPQGGSGYLHEALAGGDGRTARSVFVKGKDMGAAVLLERSRKEQPLLRSRLITKGQYLPAPTAGSIRSREGPECWKAYTRSKLCVELHNAEADSVYLEAYVTVGLVT